VSYLTRYGLIALAALVAFATIVGVVFKREHELIDQGHHEATTAVAAVQAAQAASAAVESQRVKDNQAEILRNAERTHEQDVAHNASLDAAVQRLQDSATRSERTASQVAAAASASASGAMSSADVVPRGLYDGLVNRTVRLSGLCRDLAKSLGCSRSHGTTCADDYDALTP
jgi:hypothetical protein